jgi:hypothetical protein
MIERMKEQRGIPVPMRVAANTGMESDAKRGA